MIVDPVRTNLSDTEVFSFSKLEFDQVWRAVAADSNHFDFTGGDEAVGGFFHGVSFRSIQLRLTGAIKGIHEVGQFLSKCLLMRNVWGNG